MSTFAVFSTLASLSACMALALAFARPAVLAAAALAAGTTLFSGLAVTFAFAGHAMLTFTVLATGTTLASCMAFALALARLAVFAGTALAAGAALFSGLAVTFHCCADRVNNRHPGHGTYKQHCQYQNPELFEHIILLAFYMVDYIKRTPHLQRKYSQNSHLMPRFIFWYNSIIGALFIMILKNHIHIAVRPEKLWGLVADPVHCMSWNPKIKKVIPVKVGEPQAGAQYRIRYHLVGGENNYTAELMEYEAPVRCVLHLKGGTLPGRGYIQEIYEIADQNDGCVFTQTILIEQAGMLFPGSVKIRIMNFFGAGSARRYLKKLKGQAESSIADPACPSPSMPA